MSPKWTEHSTHTEELVAMSSSTEDPAYFRPEILCLSVAVDPKTSNVFVVFSEINKSIRLTPNEREALHYAVIQARVDQGIPATAPGIDWLADFCAYVVPTAAAPVFRRDVFATGIITYFDDVRSHGRLRLVHCYCASIGEPDECQLAMSRLQEALVVRT
jgi:hypothetical protein